MTLNLVKNSSYWEEYPVLNFFAYLIIISSVVMLGGLVWLLVEAIRKKHIKIPIIVSVLGAVILIISFVAAIGLSDDTSTNTSNTSDSEASSTSSLQKPKFVGLNKEQILYDSKGHKLFSVTITEAGQNWNNFATEQGENLFNGKKDKTLQLSINYHNYGISSQWMPSDQDFTVYDDSGKAGEDAGYMDGQNEITSGHQAASTMWYFMSKPISQTKYVEIEYTDSATNSETVTYKIPLNH